MVVLLEGGFLSFRVVLGFFYLRYMSLERGVSLSWLFCYLVSMGGYLVVLAEETSRAFFLSWVPLMSGSFWMVWLLSSRI